MKTKSNFSSDNPVGNTGSGFKGKNKEEVVCIGIDYLSVTGRFKTQEEVDSAIDFAVTGFIEDIPQKCVGKPASRGITWRNSGSSLTGITFYWNRPEDTGESNYHLCIVMPGGYLSRLGIRNQFRLLTGLWFKFNMAPTRIDIAIDDYKKRLKPREIWDLCEQNKLAGVKKYQFISSLGKKNRVSETVYLGSRQSEKFVRVYDTYEQHGTDAIRFELEMKDQKAVEYVRQTMEIITEASKEQSDWLDIVINMISAVIFGSFDLVTFSVNNDRDNNGGRYFRDRIDKSLHLRDARLQSLIDDTSGGTLKLACGREKPTIERTLLWLEKQVSQSLGVLREAFGYEKYVKWANSMAVSGAGRHSEKHVIQIASFDITEANAQMFYAQSTYGCVR